MKYETKKYALRGKCRMADCNENQVERGLCFYHVFMLKDEGVFEEYALSGEGWADG